MNGLPSISYAVLAIASPFSDRAADSVSSVELLPDEVSSVELLSDEVSSVELLSDDVSSVELLPDEVSSTEPLSDEVFSDEEFAEASELLLSELSVLFSALELCGVSLLSVG